MPTEHRLSLPLGTVLHQYQLESVLGYGGFGIVYKARHQLLDQFVAIKEYLPQEIATRESSTVHPLSRAAQKDFDEGLKRVLAEAKQLVQFTHPNIIRCRDFFRANGTAYLVMDFEDGLPLSELLSQRETRNAPLSEDEILGIVLPLLNGLSLVHGKGVLHRDIKPGNLYINRKSEQPVLIDFGAAKQDFSQYTKSMAPYSPGYAAVEQIEELGNLGPWTDIYGLGAVMWRIVSGSNPPPKVESRLVALSRNKPDPMTSLLKLHKESFSTSFLQSIDKAISLNQEDRYQSVEEFTQALISADHPESLRSPPELEQRVELDTGSSSAIVTSERNPALDPINDFTESNTDKGSQWPTLAAGTLIIALIIAGLLFIPFGEPTAELEEGGVIAQQDEIEPTDDNSDSRTQEEPVETIPPSAEREAEANERLIFELAGPMVDIPTGSFQMGSNEGEPRERPVHAVQIWKAFSLGQNEVTFAQYDRFAEETGIEKPDDAGFGRGSRPVINVGWTEAQAFIQWLNQRTGEKFRLPSESEWEYAARAGTSTRYSWGDEVGSSRANCNGCGGQWNGQSTAPVSSYSANDFGLFDMHGNVWEWVEDCVYEDYSDPFTPVNGSPRRFLICETGQATLGVRGGAWDAQPPYLRSAARAWGSRTDHYQNVGFRLAQDTAILTITQSDLEARSSSMTQSEIEAQRDNSDFLPLVKVIPEYPSLVLQAGIEGWAQIRFTIKADGSTADLIVTASEPPGIFDDSAFDAVRQFRYTPKIVNGMPVEFPNVSQLFSFNLSDTGAEEVKFD